MAAILRGALPRPEPCNFSCEIMSFVMLRTIWWSKVIVANFGENRSLRTAQNDQHGQFLPNNTICFLTLPKLIVPSMLTPPDHPLFPQSPPPIP